MMRDRVNRASQRGSGFTLVELLVVIGIITILIGILMPVLSKARVRALSTQCANNLRGMGQAWTAYAEGNKGTVCPGRLPRNIWTGGVYGVDGDDQYRPHWYELLGAMVKKHACKNPKLVQDDSWTITDNWFLCPAVDWRNSRNYPFGYNYQFLGNARPRPDGQWIRYPVKANMIKGAVTVMAADCMGTAAGKPTNQRTAHYDDGVKDLSAVGNKGWALDPPRLLANSDYADPERRNPKDRSGPDPRHVGRVNVVFCDGHVESLTPQDLGYVVNFDGSMPASNASATNKWFSGSGNNDDPPRAF